MARAIGASQRDSLRSGKAKKLISMAVALVFFGLMASPSVASGQNFGQSSNSLSRDRQGNPYPDMMPPRVPKPSAKQKQALLDYNFKQLKKHAADLAELAKSLQKEIEKSNENVLSLEIVKKANQVEKLAKKIKNEAKGY